jgi:hypothetical protein
MVNESYKQIMLEMEQNLKIIKEKNDIEKEMLLQKEQLMKDNEKLRNELNELIIRLDNKEGKRITANRQLLLFHYLGFLDNLKFPSKEKKYNLLYFLIDKNRQAVKYFLNYREQLKTEEYKKIFNEKDISFVLELFREVGLLDIAKKVETDIIRLNF